MKKIIPYKIRDQPRHVKNTFHKQFYYINIKTWKSCCVGLEKHSIENPQRTISPTARDTKGTDYSSQATPCEMNHAVKLYP